MPERITKQRSPQRRDDETGGAYDLPGHVHAAPGSKVSDALKTSQQADKTVGDIDAVLADNDASKKSLSKPALANKEKGGEGKDPAKDKASAQETEKLGKGFSKGAPEGSENNKTLRKRARRALWGTHKRKVLTGFAVGSLGGGLIFGGLVLLAPLKLVHITQNLQNHYFAAGENAVDGTLDNLMKHYVIKQVLPGMLDGLCTSTRVDRSCAARVTGSGPVAQVFRAWRDAKLESKLALNHGIEFMKRGTGKDAVFYIRTPDIGPEGVRLGTYDKIVSYDGNLFAEIDVKDRNKVRLAMKGAFAHETLWKRVMYRYKVGRFLERKYGIVRCMFACEIRDKGRDAWGRNVTDRKNAAKALLTKTVMKPASEAVSLAVECAISGFDCTAFQDADNDGNRKTKYEQQLLARVAALHASGGSVDDLLRDSDNIRQKGMTYHLVERVAGTMSARMASKAIPIIGWIDLVVFLKEGLERAGPAIRYLSYAYTTSVMINQFTTMRVAADEVKDGYNTEATIIGSLTDELSTEGGYTAEQSPLWAELMPSGGTPVASIVSPRVDAQGVPAILRDVCNDEPIPGEKICPNESLKTGPGRS